MGNVGSINKNTSSHEEEKPQETTEGVSAGRTFKKASNDKDGDLSNLEKLPDELIVQLFEKLNDNDLLAFTTTGQRFSGIASQMLSKRIAERAVVTEEDGFFKRVIHRGVLTVEWIKAHGELLNTDMLELSGVSDEDLEELSTKLKQIKFLDLTDNSITDEGLKIIVKHFNQLAGLNISGTQITPEGMLLTNKMENLEVLGFRSASPQIKKALRVKGYYITGENQNGSPLNGRYAP